MCAKKIKEKKDVKETYSQLARSYYSDLTANDMLYAKIIRSIKTSIEVEDNGGMAAIDISGND